MSQQKIKKLCVYCGSSRQADQKYQDLAFSVGCELAEKGIAVVYGGGNIGLMGQVANGALFAGGEVFGVIPHYLKELELAHTGLTELYVTQSMHERKALMSHLSDGFIALPGGYGTLEELIEVTTWSQLNYHHKPVGLLNAFSYYDHLLQWIEHASNEQFIRGKHKQLIAHDADISKLLEKMQNIEFVDLKKTI